MGWRAERRGPKREPDRGHGVAPQPGPPHGGRRGTALFVALFALSAAAVLVFAVFFARLALTPAPTQAPAPAPSPTAPPPTPAPTPTPTPEPTPSAVTLDAPPQNDDYVGRLTIEGTAVDCEVYYGDSETQFSKGAGVSMGSCIPGAGGTVMIGAHTGTYFRDLESVVEGADIAITTDYGEYHYTVTRCAVVEETDTTAYDLDAAEENIILFTCYPFGILTRTTQRYLVYGDFVSGPPVVWQQP